jgi:hypothetical protein
MIDEIDYELLERAMVAYRATEPRPRIMPTGVRKFHSIEESKADRDRRIIEWFLSTQEPSQRSGPES